MQPKEVVFELPLTNHTELAYPTMLQINLHRKLQMCTTNKCALNIVRVNSTAMRRKIQKQDNPNY